MCNLINIIQIILDSNKLKRLIFFFKCLTEWNSKIRQCFRMISFFRHLLGVKFLKTKIFIIILFIYNKVPKISLACSVAETRFLLSWPKSLFLSLRTFCYNSIKKQKTNTRSLAIAFDSCIFFCRKLSKLAYFYLLEMEQFFKFFFQK